MRLRTLPSRHFLGIAAVAALAALDLQPAHALTATATFQVTATVLKACAVSTPATLAFGAYTPSTPTPTTGTTTFNVTCTVGTAYSVGLNAGTGTGASVTNRLMTSATAAVGNNTLGYGLFKDSGYATNWDNSVSASDYTGTGSTQPFTIYGAIPAGQYAAGPATDYADTIVLLLTY
ncbi:Csu type fimbrial protein [Methylibium sp.]|uniref:Csu type fimbrial protein n=1 Tax=Methylibium sp. TaxID=2067992 RepID=UPI003D106C37